MTLDKAIFKALGLSDYIEEKEIKKLHMALAKEIEHLHEMMIRD
jgi:uncharacterized protein YlaN (UPF0358 family)